MGRLPLAGSAWLDAQLAGQRVHLSVISRIELLTKTTLANEYQLMQAFVQSIVVLPLDESVVTETIRLRQQHRIKLPDALIAATALAHGLTLVTRNTPDFQAIPGLHVLNPHEVG